jgi:hypothetical protein
MSVIQRSLTRGSLATFIRAASAGMESSSSDVSTFPHGSKWSNSRAINSRFATMRTWLNDLRDSDLA